MKFEEEVDTGVNRRGQNDFSPGGTPRGISRYCAKLANLRTKARGKLHKHVTLWVWERIWCGEREKVRTGVLYQVQKCFSPGVPNVILLHFASFWSIGGFGQFLEAFISQIRQSPKCLMSAHTNAGGKLNWWCCFRWRHQQFSLWSTFSITRGWLTYCELLETIQKPLIYSQLNLVVDSLNRLFDQPHDDPSSCYVSRRRSIVSGLQAGTRSLSLTSLATFWSFSDLNRLQTHRDTVLNTPHTHITGFTPPPISCMTFLKIVNRKFSNH